MRHALAALCAALSIGGIADAVTATGIVTGTGGGGGLSEGFKDDFLPGR